MRFPRKRGSTSVKIRIFIPDNSVTTGAGCTGLTYASTNLAVAYSRANDNGGTEITGANLVDITTIGTWANPGTGKVGFKAVDATKFPGLYELHFADSAAFGTGDTSEAVYINVYEKTTTALKIGPNMVLIPLSALQVIDGESDVRQFLGTAPTEGAAGRLAAAFTKFFDKATPTGTINSLPDAVAGAASGLAIVGSNMGTATLANGAHGGAATTITLQTPIAASVSSVPDSAGVTTILGQLTGITSLANWLRGLFRKSAMDATAKTEVNSGGGTYDEATDSNEAIRDTAPLGTAMRGTDNALLAASYTAPLDAAGTRGAVGLAAANLDTQLSGINAKTTNLPSDPADESLIIAATDAIMTRIGVAGAGLTALGDTRLANLDVAVSTRTKPADTQAAVTTVTNLTNAPTNGDLTAAMKASVNAEVVDALATDAYGEPGLGAPAASTSLAAKIGYLFKAWRNKATQDGSWYKLYADDRSTVDQKAAVSDDTTTATKDEIVSGP